MTIKDPSTEHVADTLGSMAGIAGMVVPPPAGIVIGLGMGILGSLFGSQEEPDLTNTELLDAVEAHMRDINSNLVSMADAISDLKVAMEVVSMMTRYNIVVVEKVYQKLCIDPFHNIHAAYTNLIETFMPSSGEVSWNPFFERANILREEFDAEVYDAFDYDNLRSYLMWYDAAIINDSGMCGKATLYIMSF